MREFRQLFASLAGCALLGLAPAACQRSGAPEDAQAEATRLFESLCARCHGREGRGGIPAAEGLPSPTNFHDADFQASRSDAQLADVIRGGKGPMPPFKGVLDDSQIELMVRHIRSFAPKK